MLQTDQLQSAIRSKELPERGASSEARVIASLYRRHAAALHRLARRYLRCERDAEDVIQELFVRLCRPGQLESLKSPDAVLFKAASRLALNELRRRKSCALATAGEIDEEAFKDETPDPERTVSARLALETYRSAVEQLPPPCRRVVSLRRLQGWSFKEIGAELGLPVSTLEKQMRRANLLLGSHMMLKDLAEGTNAKVKSSEMPLKGAEALVGPKVLIRRTVAAPG